jgi:hypothetical protein
MRRHGLIDMIVACILIVLITGMIPLNYAHKLSRGCPFSHNMKAKLSPCFHDSVTSSSDLAGAVALPASGPAGPEEVPVRTASAFDFRSPTVNALMEGPPLRC